MLMDNAIVVIAVAAATLVIVFLRKKCQSTQKEQYPLPPGPPARGFFGNVVPTTNISSTFNDWADKYGPVLTLRQGSDIAILITRVDAASEIMEKQGSALADRPRMIAGSELLSGGKRISLIGNSERYRRLRRAVHSHLQVKAVETYKDAQFEQAKTLVLYILRNPREHQQHVHRYSISVILRITYGKTSPISMDDPEVLGVMKIVEHFIEGMRPGAYFVDRFPWLRYVPGYGRRLKSYHESDLKFYRGQLDRVRLEMTSGEAGPSFSRTLLENIRDHQLSFDEMSYLAGTLFEAGYDTSKDAIIAMIMAAACFPDAQLQVQEELDRVVGMDRLPSWNDWDTLPQLHAFISEVLRWRPITPLGFSHRSTRDIIWRGYRIPSGTTVMANLWTISRDPIAFPDPEKFDPQRWLDKDGQLRKDVECYPFGFGRRLCPGVHLAKRSLFVTLALLLWSFRITERPEAPIDTTPDRDNVVAHLAQFEVDFVPRIGEMRLREAMAT